MAFLVRTIVVAFALWLATVLVSGISLAGESSARSLLTLVLVALIFGVVNAVLKPLILVVGCSLYVLTLGLFALVANALLFWLTAWLAEVFSLPFTVDGFWPAFWGALVVSIVTWIMSLALPRRQDLQA
ncbi:phage holin family protein [Natronoglycomyces albus]|uniref:Phage holin family protein n=1 Tax=Natronoglycomyces albus TaxID=2811108 RepID=A0A895XRB8_9ACTN|nr:phage holin family protein [Natronoglycomyces albus]QSB06073.1 phage holin family protein [Natronoglycomyces albus]